MSDTPAIPRRTFGLVMGVSTAVALGLTWMVAVWIAQGTPLESAGPASARAAVLALLIGSIATLGPALMRVGVDHWGFAVLLSGVARAMLALAVGFLLTQTSTGLEPRPLFMGVCAGAVLLLIIETALCISILSRLDRAQEHRRAGALPAGASPTTSH
ncbi:MAG: hypothetical protein AB7K52_06875 [Phycisphaerales bacterium]